MKTTGQLVYTLFDEPPDFYKAALSISRKFANVPIAVIDTLTDGQRMLGDRINQKRRTPTRVDWGSLLRWDAIYYKALGWGPDQWPIFCADWDVAVCADLIPLFMGTDHCDLCLTLNDVGVSGPAYVIHRIEPLRAYHDMLWSMVETRCPFLDDINDMALWASVKDAYHWKVNFVNFGPWGAVDHNIVCGETFFQMEPSGLPPEMGFPERKKIVYDKDKVYFEKLDGTPVRALTVHCWHYFRPLVFELQKRLLQPKEL